MRRTFLLFVLGFALAALGSWMNVAHAQTPTASVTLRWTAPTAHTDDTPITTPLTYNVYAGVRGAAKAKIGTTSAGITTYIASVPIGSCFAVSAVESGAGESAQTAEVCMLSVPKPPGAVTFVTITVQ